MLKQASKLPQFITQLCHWIGRVLRYQCLSKNVKIKIQTLMQRVSGQRPVISDATIWPSASTNGATGFTTFALVPSVPKQMRMKLMMMVSGQSIFPNDENDEYMCQLFCICVITQISHEHIQESILCQRLKSQKSRRIWVLETRICKNMYIWDMKLVYLAYFAVILLPDICI